MKINNTILTEFMGGEWSEGNVTLCNKIRFDNDLFGTLKKMK